MSLILSVLADCLALKHSCFQWPGCPQLKQSPGLLYDVMLLVLARGADETTGSKRADVGHDEKRVFFTRLAFSSLSFLDALDSARLMRFSSSESDARGLVSYSVTTRHPDSDASAIFISF